MNSFKTQIEENEQIKLIEELRELKEVRKMTYQEISDNTVKNGEYVSVSNIKKVFSPEQKHRHDYNKTLVPIFNALNDSADKENPVNHVYQTRLEIKNATIRKLQDEMNDLKEEYKERLKTKDEKHKDREQFFMDQIERLQDEIKFKNDEILRFRENIDRKDATIKELYSTIIKNKGPES